MTKLLYFPFSLDKVEFKSAEGLCVAAVATKEINIGEEVLVTYGYPYWSSVNTTQF